MKMNVDSLVLEVTRKCNMKCAHCLRGDAQNKSMDRQTLYQTLRGLDYIGCVTFSGGEPTLNMGIIEDFNDYCRWYREQLEVGNFYIVTNGRVFRQRLVDLCDELYNVICTDNEISGLTVSDDSYHSVYRPDNRLWKRNWNRYMFEDEYCDYERPYARPTDKKVVDYGLGLINMGRAQSNGIGMRELTEEKVHYRIYDDETVCVSEPALYVTVNGDVILGCDWSYKEMSKHCIGNVNNWDQVVGWVLEHGENDW